MLQKLQNLATTSKQRGKRRSGIHSTIGILSIISIIAIAVLAVFIILKQGTTQGLITLTVISIVIGMIIGILTLMINFFQWRGSLSSHHELSPSHSSQTPSLPAPSSHPASGSVSSSTTWIGWGEVPQRERFSGRVEELAQLQRWIVAERVRVVGIVGSGGIGKTALATMLAQQLANEFQYIFWCSLQTMPLFENILSLCLSRLSDNHTSVLLTSLDEQISLLLKLFRQRRCLLIFDNLESLLQSGTQAGSFKDDYTGMDRLLEIIGTELHQSCLLLTSREKPHTLARLEGTAQPLRSLHLQGMSPAEARVLLQDQGLSGSDEAWNEFITRYHGNPLALKLVSETIRELFQSSISAFLAEETLLLSSVRDVLDKQFERLSVLEKNLLYWLAIELEGARLDDLQRNGVHQVSKGELMGALTSLRRRSLLETSNRGYFTLQSVIRAYMTEKLIRQVCRDIETTCIETLEHYPLFNVSAKDSLSISQKQHILQPVVTLLLSSLGKAESEYHLKSLLTLLQETRREKPGYAAGNILNLLLELDSDLRGWDFSHLVIWEGQLQGARLPAVNFTAANLERCRFTETFGNILCLTLAHTRPLLAAGTADGEIKLWDLSSGKSLLTFQGHTDWIRTLAFSPDDELLASAGDDQNVYLWEVSTGQCLRTLQGHAGRVYTVAFDHQGTTLASAGDDQTIWFWEVSTGYMQQTFQQQDERIRSLAFHPNDRWLASAGDDHNIHLWETLTGKCLIILRGHQQSIQSSVFSPDGMTLISGSDDQTIRIWETGSGRCLHTLRGHTGRVQTVALNADGSLIASGSNDHSIRLWNTTSGDCISTLYGHSNRVRAVAFSETMKMLVSGGDDQSIRVWDVNSMECLKILHGHTSWIYSVAFSPDGICIGNDSDGQNISLWNASTGKDLKTLQGHTSWIYSLAFSPQGTTLASGSDDHSIRLWDINTAHCLKILHKHTGRIRSVAFSPDGSLLASGSDDQQICLWDVNTGHYLRTFQGHSDRVRTVAFSPDSSTLLSAGEDQQILLWEIGTGQHLKTFRSHIGRVWSLCFHPDGTTFASGGDDFIIRLWSRSSLLIKTLQGHSGRVYCVAFRPDGTMFASASEDQTIRLWEYATCQCLKILRGHHNRVRSVAFNSDGTRLVSGSHDGTVKQWDTQTGVCVATWKSERPYERMNITGVTGLTPSQKEKLRLLGAIDSSNG